MSFRTGRYTPDTSICNRPPTLTDTPMTVSLIDGLDADGLELVLDEATKDTFGNHVVPGLAQLAMCRTLCKSFRDTAARLRTVYDAEIEYEAYGLTTVPVRFRGGLCHMRYGCRPQLCCGLGCGTPRHISC